MSRSLADALDDMRVTIEDASTRLLAMSEQECEVRREAGKWSAKEILGHLIDSAANNHPRFVTAQLKDDLIFEGYDQEAWVDRQRYHQSSWLELVTLWKAYNLHLLHVITSIPDDKLTRSCNRHSLNKIAWKIVGESEPATLEYLILDYIDHMKHHLRQILGESDVRINPAP